MKKSTYFWLGLSVLVLVVAYYIIHPTERKEESYQIPELKLALDITKLVKVEIERNKKSIRMERIHNVWKVTDPVNFVVDDEAIYRLLEGMAKFKLTGLVSSNPEKFGMFELGDNGTTLTVTYEDGAPTSVIVGKAGPTPNQSYVRTVNSNSVYLARGLSAIVVNRELRDWRQRTIYHADPDAIKYFKLESDSGNFVLRRDGKRWLVNRKVVSNRNINPVLNALSYIRAEDFIDTALVINSPRELHVEFVAPELVRFDIYGQGRGKYFLKTSFSPTIFVVSNAMVQDLRKLADQLATPAPAPSVVSSFGVQPRPAAKDTEISPAAQQVLSTLSSLQSLAPSYTSEEEQGELVIHTFQRGQTLPDVAKKYKVTVEQIRKWNLLKSDQIKPGMDLYIFTKKKK